MTLVTLRRYLQPLDAELDLVRLTAEGIPAFLQDATLLTLTTTDSAGVRLQVAEEHLARAKEVLEAGLGEVVTEEEKK